MDVQFARLEKVLKHRGNPFETQYPIVQAPMAGGASTPELVAAVSNAGGLGTFAAGYLSPQAIKQACERIRELTALPFGINLFIPTPYHVHPEQITAMQQRLQPYRDELGIATPSIQQYHENFAEQCAAVMDSGASVFSFTFGILPEPYLTQAKAKGMQVWGTATTVAEGVALQNSGVDGVIAQGFEAGGHRGAFLSSPEQSVVGTMALVPQLADALTVPVMAAGGIMDGRGIRAALTLGASAVALGTAFLACPESGAAAAYKQALLHASEADTTLTQAFSGRYARGVKNRFLEEFAHEDGIPDYPIQNTLTRDIRAAAAQQGRSEFLSLWAGQGVGMIRSEPAIVLMQRLIAEYQKIPQ